VGLFELVGVLGGVGGPFGWFVRAGGWSGMGGFAGIGGCFGPCVRDVWTDLWERVGDCG